MSPLIFGLFQFSALAYAVLGGVFLAFSDFIMRSLANTGGAGGVEAMQVINREVFRWVFMTLFLGMAAVSVFMAIYCMLYSLEGAGAFILAGAVIYLLGCFAVTVLFNVPLNEALAAMDFSETATQEYWTGTYLPQWTKWNTVRTVACLLAAAMMLFGVVSFALSQAQVG